jgi:hypothetical protein
MKAGILMVLFAGFVVAPGGAQTFDLGTNGLWTTNAAAPQPGSKLSLQEQALPGSKQILQQPALPGLRLGEPGDTNSVDYVVSKTKLHLSGPVASTLPSKSAGDFTRRFLRLFNPVSSARQNLPPGAEVSGPVNTRAWSTLVGWSPGRSAFPDEQHHEPPGLRLISVSAEQQP